MAELSMDTDHWARLAPWRLYKSDLILTVSHILTEPTCPTVFVRFEMPERAGIDLISSGSGDTIDEAVAVALERADQKLQVITDDREEILKINDAVSLDDLPEAKTFPATELLVDLQALTDRACMLSYTAYANEVPQERAYLDLSNRIQGDFVFDMAFKTRPDDIAARIQDEISTYVISPSTRIYVSARPTRRNFMQRIGLEVAPNVRADLPSALMEALKALV